MFFACCRKGEKATVTVNQLQYCIGVLALAGHDFLSLFFFPLNATPVHAQKNEKR
jgi:hypothetical protein